MSLSADGLAHRHAHCGRRFLDYRARHGRGLSHRLADLLAHHPPAHHHRLALERNSACSRHQQPLHAEFHGGRRHQPLHLCLNRHPASPAHAQHGGRSFGHTQPRRRSLHLHGDRNRQQHRNGPYSGISTTYSLTVGKPTATVTLGNLAQTYTGSPLSATATTVPTGLA